VSVINVICASAAPCSARQTRSAGGAARPFRPPGLAARTARRESLDAEAVVVTARDFMVLEELARLWLRPHEPAARALVEKLERCHVVPPDAVATDVVTLNSRVVFNAEGGEAEARVLVHPGEHAVPGWSLPVTTPRGLAILGRRAGSTVTAERHGTGAERIRILSVAYQPEEAARRRRATTPDAAASSPPSFLRKPAGARSAGRRPPHGGEDPPPAACPGHGGGHLRRSCGRAHAGVPPEGADEGPRRARLADSLAASRSARRKPSSRRASAAFAPLRRDGSPIASKPARRSPDGGAAGAPPPRAHGPRAAS
jgi:regulator of nucleoside diphosphate kinase